MQTTFLVNGETRLVLTPSSETERLLLMSLTEGDIEMAAVSDKVNLLGQTIAGAVVIKKKGKEFQLEDRIEDIKEKP